jgi:diguanylate cyclase (GGDEF)-like protein
MLKKERTITIILSVMILTSLLYVLFSLNKLSTYNTISKISSQKGILELSNWDFNKDGHTALSGQWEFYWQQLLTPEELATKAPAPSYIEMPMLWSKNNKNYDSNGYATYSLTIKLNHKYKNDLLAIRVPELFSSYKLWVNGDLLSSKGVISTEKAYEIPKILPTTNYFVSNSEELHLVLQISNHNFRDGGAIDEIYLGTSDQMSSKREASIALEVLYFGALLVMGLYYMYLYTFNLNTASNFYFGALCIVMALRVVLVSNTYFLTLYDNLSNNFIVKGEYLTLYVIVYLVLGYIYVMFKNTCSKIIIRSFKGFCYLFMIITIFAPLLLASKLLIIFQIFTLLMLLYILFVIFREYRSRKHVSYISKINYIVSIIIATSSLLYYLGISNTKDYSLLGFFIILLLNTFILAMNQSNIYKNAEKLSIEKDQYLLSKRLSEVTFLLNSSLNLEEVLDKLLISLRDLVPYESAAFFTEEHGHFTIMAATGFKNMEILHKVSIDKEEDALFKEIHETKSTLFVSNVKSDPRFKYYDNKSIIESWLGIPIIFKNKIIGILTLDSTQKNIYTDYHCSIAIAFASQAGVAIENAKLYGRIKKLANIDPLTNLYNRRSFFELANLSFDKAKALQQSISAIMIDVDDFKKINDKLGHHIGDLVLKRLSKVCAENLSSNHILGRYGGEEFIALLPNTSFEDAKVIAENLRSAIDSNPIIIRKSDSIPITSSFGVASITPTTQDLELLFITADKAMYQAKSLGKNKVISINLDV